MAYNLYRWYADLHRMGKIDSLFLAEQHKIDNAIGKYYNLGEVLGKHSNVYGTLEKEEITLVSTNPVVIDELLKASNMSNTICGYNPLKYIWEECSNCGDEVDPDEMITGMCNVCYDEWCDKQSWEEDDEIV